MSTRIGLISDIHATPAPLERALAIFARESIETILCAGDIAGYGPDLEASVELLIGHNCRTIAGNHDLWYLDHFEDEQPGPAEVYLRTLPVVDRLSIAGKEICLVHGSPPDSVMLGIKLRDEHGALLEAQKIVWAEQLTAFPADVLIVGHTHQVFAERLADTLVINPGSTRFNQTCAILTLPELEVEIISLTGDPPALAWNWGMEIPEEMKKR